MSGEDFLSSFKKSIDDNKVKGKSVIEDLQITIKERENTITQRDEHIKELEAKIKDLTIMAKDAFLAPKQGGQRPSSVDDDGALKEKLEEETTRARSLQDQVKELQKNADKLKRLEGKVDEQRKEILQLRQKKDFDLSQFLEEGEDPTLVSQIRVLKTRIKSLEKQLQEDKLDELKEDLGCKNDEVKTLQQEVKKQRDTIVELESRIEILEHTPPPPAPPVAGPVTGAPAGPAMPDPPSLSAPPAAPRFTAPPPPPPAPGPSVPPAPGQPSPPPAPVPAAPVSPAIPLPPGTAGGGAGNEASTLQKDFKNLQAKYQTMVKEVDEFKVSNDPQTILNLKTRRIYDLQDEIKKLRKEQQTNTEVQEARDLIRRATGEIEEKTRAIESLEAEKQGLIYYYNDLKEKYEQVYNLIMERDQVIAELQHRLG